MPAIWEKYLAQVTDNQDKDQLGRIRVSCPDLVGAYLEESQDIVIEGWIDPIHDWSWFYIPDVDEVVEIEILVSSDEDEVAMQSAMYNPQIRWRGKRYWGGEETNQPRPVPDDFKTNYGKRRGFATPRGHVFLFDDTEGDELITLKLAKNEDFVSLELNKDGEVNITADVCNVLAATEVNLGDNATEAVVKGDTWKTLFDGHKHPTGVGPSGPPIAGDPIPSADCLSTKVNTE